MKTSFLSLAVLVPAFLSVHAQELPSAPPLIRIVVETHRFPQAEAVSLLGPKASPENADALLARIKTLEAKGAGVAGGPVAATAQSGLAGLAESGDRKLRVEPVRSPAGDSVDVMLRFETGGKSLATNVLIRENESVFLGTLAARDAAELVFARYEKVETPSQSQPEPSLPHPAVQAVFSAIGRVLAGLDSIEFQSVHEYRPTALYAEINKRPPSQGQKVEVTFLGRGERYALEKIYQSHDGDSPRDEESVFNGTTLQKRHAGNLSERRASAQEDHLQLSFYSPLNMFGFLMSQVPGDRNTVRWDYVKNTALWQATLTQAQFVGEQDFAGKSCLVARIRGENSIVAPGPCFYTVYFSKEDGLFPAGWKVEDPNGKVLVDYLVKEFGRVAVNGQDFYYPKKAESTWYASSRNPPENILGVFTTETLMIRINTIPNDFSFTLGPQKIVQARIEK